jgi:hypothetical protein
VRPLTTVREALGEFSILAASFLKALVIHGLVLLLVLSVGQTCWHRYFLG